MAFVRSPNIMIDWRAPHLIVFALFRTGTAYDGFFRYAEITSEGVAGNVASIVHTAFAFIRRLMKLPHKKTA